MNIQVNPGGAAIVLNTAEFAEFFMSYTMIAAKALEQPLPAFMMAVQLLTDPDVGKRIPPELQMSFKTFMTMNKVYMELAKHMDEKMALEILKQYGPPKT